MNTTTNSRPTLTATQHSDLLRLLRCLRERLQTLEPSSSDGESVPQLLRLAMLVASRMRIAMNDYGFADIDLKRLSDLSLSALMRDPAVPLSAKREIDVLLNIRELDQDIDRAFRDAGRRGQTTE